MKVKTIASHGVDGSRGSRWFRTWGFIGMSAAAIAIFAPQASALSLSRGQQTLDVPYQECLRRAHAAFVAEGFDAQPSQGASFVGGFRGSSGGYITCNPLTEGRMVVNVFVASEGTSDSNVPGAFRVRLQQRMESGAVSPPVAPPPQPKLAEPPRNPNYEYDVDRPGSDYRNFDLQAANPDLCAAQCAQDGRCRAWTYVRPGAQGPNARCWLKDQVPNPVANVSKAISGVKRTAGPPPPPNVGGGKLPPNFTTGSWTYLYESGGYTEQQAFSDDGTVRGSVPGKWAVEGDELVVRWSHGWVMRYPLPAVNGKMVGTALRPEGSRHVTTLSRQ